jgi:ribosomal-protein-alanine N-acetyltransferase
LQLGRQLIGYSIQTGAAGEAHLLNLCVARQWQRRGFGALLLDNAIRIARGSGCESMFLEVRPSNSAAIALYLTRGFVIAGKRFGYYSAAGNATSGPNVQSAPRLVAAREDALVMRLQLSDTSSPV